MALQQPLVVSLLTPEELAEKDILWLTDELWVLAYHMRSRVKPDGSIVGAGKMWKDIGYLQSVSAALAAKVR